MDHPNTWSQFLPWAEYSYNYSYHSSIGYSPFQVVYGHPPPSIIPYNGHPAAVEAVDTMLQQRDAILRQLKHNLYDTQIRVKQIDDKKRHDLSFEVEDKVMVKSQPYHQSSLSRQTYSKLNRHFYGPFTVIAKIGEVAYKLYLPKYSKIHPIFHVSRLKPFRENLAFHPLLLPSLFEDGHPLVLPVVVLQSRQSVKNGVLEKQFLIQWECQTPENSNFLKNGKIVISVKIRKFSRSRMTKRTSPLKSSREI